MSNLKIQGFNNLEKDPSNGAILLNSNQNVECIKLDNLMRKLKIVENQNKQILELLEQLSSKTHK